MASAEYYTSFKEIRCFGSDLRIEYEPPLAKIEKNYFSLNEGKFVNVAICCRQCGCLLVTERRRRILSLPSTDWESIHFGAGLQISELL